MSPFLLRQIWIVVESTPSSMLLNFDDTSLVKWVLDQVKAQHPLSTEEHHVLSSYLYGKLSLIRDIADQQMVA